VVAGQVLPEQVKTSEWIAWLGDQPWFIRDPARLSENFPLAVKYRSDHKHIGRDCYST
jgi:hypothetical protein